MNSGEERIIYLVGWTFEFCEVQIRSAGLTTERSQGDSVDAFSNEFLKETLYGFLRNISNVGT